MKKVFDIALICVIIIVAFYACSEDYFAPHEENLELNAHDPRLELIAEIDSTKLQESGVETLALGESIVPQDQVRLIPIHSDIIQGIMFTLYARINYSIDSSGITIKGKHSYVKANKSPYPAWEQTLFTFRTFSGSNNSRTYLLTLKGYLNYDELYPEGGGYEFYVNIEDQIVQL
jgi:hypothetical protein